MKSLNSWITFDRITQTDFRIFANTGKINGGLNHRNRRHPKYPNCKNVESPTMQIITLPIVVPPFDLFI